MELLFEYYYDKKRERICLNCKHYFKCMGRYDAEVIMHANSITEERKAGQKYCLKNKSFVYFSDCCGWFDWRGYI